MYCSQCGREVKPGSRFCAGCGAPLGTAKPTADEVRDISREAGFPKEGAREVQRSQQAQQPGAKSATETFVSESLSVDQAAALSRQPVSKTATQNSITSEVETKTSSTQFTPASQAVTQTLEHPHQPILGIRLSPAPKWLIALGLITLGLLGYLGYSHYENKQQLERVRASAQTALNAQTTASQTTHKGEADLPIAAPPDTPSTTASPVESADIPGVNVGDTYVVESQYPQNAKLNNTTERKVISVLDGEITVASRNVKSTSDRSRIVRFTREWNLVGSRNSDGTGVAFAPPLKYFDFPLYPGKTWKQTSVERNIKTGAIREFTLSATVGNWEDVSVPAGVFRAIKITTQTELVDREKGQESTGTDVSWYAPDARRSVKSVVTSRDMQGHIEEQLIQVVRYNLN